ncbi:hypothetical protein CPB83DRAFT_900667 [Crepidotus variabilis]|uniref:NACHT domain-containing protein n=1 Tax=Crepidotus variabilis TaxID=179855 RepID=A0A9P6E127_9AGAR|nr:hypothetical protein CPB83DRAFT_900667 [Crepidotus variabilis]
MAVHQSMDTSAALRFLYKAVAKYAGGGHQDPSICLEGTRMTALEEINEWKCKTVEEQNPEMIWVTGSAGSGKTAITQTVYEHFKAEGLLVVQTSFFRSTDCTDLKYLPLSIAYQLAVANSLLKAVIEAVVQADPAVINAPINVQLQRLVLGPISETTGQLPMVYVILDGLDKCGVEDQQIQIIQLIQAIITDQYLPIRFLIAGRPESWIQTTIISPSAPPILTVFLNQDKEADGDIQLFYKTEFTKASSQFIYAKTVTRFISEPGHSPIRRLEIVLQSNSKVTKSQLPLDQLDALYSQILSSVVDWNITSNVLGALLVQMNLHSLAQREALSIIEVLLGLNTGDAFQALRNLHSLIFVPLNLAPEQESMTDVEYKAKLYDSSQCPRFYHKSFTDFLHHPQHAGKYLIDESVTMNTLTRLFSFTWDYAHKNWDGHCTDSGFERNHQLLNDLDCFLFISWYFILPVFQGRQWKQLAPFCQLEKWNDDSLESIQTIQRTVEALGAPWRINYPASKMWWWFKQEMVKELDVGRPEESEVLALSNKVVGG